MRKINDANSSPICCEMASISEENLKSFRSATRTEYSTGMPPTYPTVFRKPEFEFLDRFQVDFRDLLHVDQEYRYLAEIVVGDKPIVTTRMADVKERKGMVFVTLTSDVVCGGIKKICGQTTFVVKKKE